MKGVILVETNENMPFMYGDAVLQPEAFDIVLHGDEFNYPLFAPPKDPVSYDRA